MSRRPTYSRQDSLSATLQEAFIKYDKKKTGKMDIHDLFRALRMLGLNPTEEQVISIRRDIDDGSGVVHFDDFCNIVRRLMYQAEQEHAADDLRVAFQMFDKEGSGYIRATEFRKVMTTLGYRMSVQEVDDILKMVDVTGDGMINYEEFITVLAA
ncbi:calmodulin-like [Branchiostoma lanceolatum]|uniref:calmodulin-like n=1 Tax=Branchiostoma lanceolatum TaxID=7740 RepID=UPI0034537E0B